MVEGMIIDLKYKGVIDDSGLLSLQTDVKSFETDCLIIDSVSVVAYRLTTLPNEIILKNGASFTTPLASIKLLKIESGNCIINCFNLKEIESLTLLDGSELTIDSFGPIVIREELILEHDSRFNCFKTIDIPVKRSLAPSSEIHGEDYLTSRNELLVGSFVNIPFKPMGKVLHYPTCGESY